MVSNDRMIMHYRGLSSDTKPDAPPNGSDWLDPTATDDADNG